MTIDSAYLYHGFLFLNGKDGKLKIPLPQCFLEPLDICLSLYLPACPNSETGAIRPSLPDVDQAGLVPSAPTPASAIPLPPSLRFTCWAEGHR